MRRGDPRGGRAPRFKTPVTDRSAPRYSPAVHFSRIRPVGVRSQHIVRAVSGLLRLPGRSSYAGGHGCLTATDRPCLQAGWSAGRFGLPSRTLAGLDTLATRRKLDVWGAGARACGGVHHSSPYAQVARRRVWVLCFRRLLSDATHNRFGFHTVYFAARYASCRRRGAGPVASVDGSVQPGSRSETAPA